MLRNYFLTAFRNLWKQRFYTVINLLGLAVGIASCILITLFVRDELQFDQHHSKADRIYRLWADIKFNKDADKVPQLPAPLAETLVRDFPEVEAAARFRFSGQWLVRHKDGNGENIRETEVLYADQSIFDIFDFELLAGDIETALTEPNTLVLNRSTAEKYFPSAEEAYGKTLTLDNDWDVKVTGVIADIPPTSHFQGDMFLSMESRQEAKQTIWLSHNFHTYALLKEGADAEALEAKFPAMLEQYAGPQVKQFLNLSLSDWEESGNSIDYHMDALTDVYLRSQVLNDLGPEGDMNNVFIFGAIALFILLLACINFMNLSTARSSNRAREVGVRKVMGSLRSHLINQFLLESVMLSLLAMALALAFSAISLPFFNDLAEKQINFPWGEGGFYFLLLILGGIIGVLAGIYPAFFLSAFKPISVLKGSLSRGASSGWLRSGLVVLQFVASITLIISTIVVSQQLQYIQNKDIGFNKEQVLMVHDGWVLGDQIESFKNGLLNQPEIVSASISSFLPVSNSSRNNTVFWPEGRKDPESQILMQNWQVDHDYLSTMNMEMVAGRDFSREYSTDSSGMILNEAAARNFGLEPEEALGFRVSTFDDISEDGVASEATLTVIGVVKDFHFESMKQDITALCMFIGQSRGNVILRVQAEEMQPVLAKLESSWQEYAPGQPIDYSFLDERFTQMYASTLKLRSIFSVFAFLAIFVACLGLFALAAFMAEQRTKEIGIRKVLGASVSQIIQLLVKDFAVLVGIALLLAIPIAWWAMDQWLSVFQYRVQIQFWVFILAGTLALALAVLTVSSQSFRVANSNPARSLKDE
ncbi:MAG: ABC transporter permease [Bacteroidota bacterium]